MLIAKSCIFIGKRSSLEIKWNNPRRLRLSRPERAGRAKPLVLNWATYPSATITVYRDHIAITDKWPHRILDFPRAGIIAIRAHLMLAEVQIVHNVVGLPPYIGFSAGAAADLALEGLMRFGYPVQMGKSIKIGDTLTRKISWASIVGPSFGAIVAFVLSFMFSARRLWFLTPALIHSGGRNVPTADFARFMGRIFLVAGIASTALALILFLIQFCQIRKCRQEKEMHAQWRGTRAEFQAQARKYDPVTARAI